MRLLLRWIRDRSTRLGRRLIAAASCSTPVAPCTAATTISWVRDSRCSAAATGTLARAAALIRSPVIICFRLEWRSARAPACKAISAGGSWPRKVNQATSAVVASSSSTASTGITMVLIELPVTLAACPVR